MRNFIICLLASFAWMTSTGQYMWQGQAGNRRVLISVERDSCGGRTACLTLPENWITRAQADRLSISGDSLSASCQNNGIRIDGTFSGGGAVLDATVVVYRDTMRMAMKRTDRLLDLYYPHNPRPPYPYTTEEVSYFSQDDSIRFAATLTLPEGEGPFPAAIIVSGTGKQDRDGSFSGHRPFHRIADYLTRRGYAILRTDDRGTGGTTGIYEEATTSDFAADALAALDYLKRRPETDPARVGVIGHSEGGLVAFMLGAEPDAAAFVISLAGVGVSGLEILTLQNRAILASTPGFTPEKTDATMDLYDHLFRTVYDTPAGIPLDTLLRRSLTEWMAQQDEHTVKLADMDNGRDQMFISRYIYSADRPWYREMIRYDPTRYIPKIGVPVLALNGNRDVNVPSQENLASIRRLLAQGGNGNFKVVEMEGLNHMFQQAVTGTSSEAAQLEEVFSEEALRIIHEWLQALFEPR